jgi:hypothetical protein
MPSLAAIDFTRDPLQQFAIGWLNGTIHLQTSS